MNKNKKLLRDIIISHIRKIKILTRIGVYWETHETGATKSRSIHEMRKKASYKRWKIMVLERDDYRCVKCYNNEKIEVDHIKPFSKFPALRLDLNNGRTLCHQCHLLTPSYPKLLKGNQCR